MRGVRMLEKVALSLPRRSLAMPWTSRGEWGRQRTSWSLQTATGSCGGKLRSALLTRTNLKQFLQVAIFPNNSRCSVCGRWKGHTRKAGYLWQLISPELGSEDRWYPDTHNSPIPSPCKRKTLFLHNLMFFSSPKGHSNLCLIFYFLLHVI